MYMQYRRHRRGGRQATWELALRTTPTRPCERWH